MQAIVPPESAPQALDLPRDLRIRARLRQRGVALRPAPGEDLETFHCRVETGLMALFRDGREPEVFEALHEFAGPALRRQVQGALRGAGLRLDPSEVCQDAFVNIYRYASSFRDDHPRSFKAWAKAISRNIVRRCLGRRQVLSWQALPEGVGEPADRRVGPQVCASLEEERASLLQAYNLLLAFYGAAFAELSERDQRALTLIEIEGKSYAEGCEILGVGMSNMKMIMFRARKRIRARLDAALERGFEELRKVG